MKVPEKHSKRFGFNDLFILWIAYILLWPYRQIMYRVERMISYQICFQSFQVNYLAFVLELRSELSSNILRLKYVQNLVGSSYLLSCAHLDGKGGGQSCQPKTTRQHTPTNLPTNQPTNQPLNHPSNQQANQPANQ
jgi:hypothetical protein